MTGPLTMGGVPTRPRVTWDQIVPGLGLYDVGEGSDITADTTIGPEANTVAVDASSGAIAITLPLLAEAHQEVVISKRDSSANAVTITCAGSDTINGASTLVLASQYDAARIRPGPTEFMVA